MTWYFVVFHCIHSHNLRVLKNHRQRSVITTPKKHLKETTKLFDCSIVLVNSSSQFQSSNSASPRLSHRLHSFRGYFIPCHSSIHSWSFSILSSSQLRFNSVKVVFTFSISLIAFAPPSSMKLPIIRLWFLSLSFLSIFLTKQTQFFQCGVFLYLFTECFCSLISNPIACRSFFSFSFSFHSLFSSFSLHKFNLVNVVLITSISLNAFAPSSPIPLSVIHSSFLFFFSFLSSALSIFNSFNVVLTLSASLRAFAPTLPTAFSVFFFHVGCEQMLLILNLSFDQTFQNDCSQCCVCLQYFT